MPHSVSLPSTLALFEKRIDGDDALMELARVRFQQARMGAEMHAGTPDELEWALLFRPSVDEPVIVHLPRDFKVSDAHSQEEILKFAARFSGRVRGLVIHDQPEMVSRDEDFRKSTQTLDSRLQSVDDSPILFIEYAVGLDPRAFTRFFQSIQSLSRIVACIDIGHVGIQQARNAYVAIYP